MNEIIEYFSNLHPVQGALYATLFTWGVTALGASSAFLFKSMSRMSLDGMVLQEVLWSQRVFGVYCRQLLK